MTWNTIRRPPPHDHLDGVLIDVHLRRVSDEVERVYKKYSLLSDDETTPLTWIWDEGSYSCDCNRYLFFQRAGDEEENDEIECTDGKYIVWIVNPATGLVVYDERQSDAGRPAQLCGW